MINNQQSKGARGLLSLSVRDLAELASVSKDTITAFENGKDVKLSTIQAIQSALEQAGVEFIPENGGGAGVRLAKRNSAK